MRSSLVGLEVQPRGGRQRRRLYCKLIGFSHPKQSSISESFVTHEVLENGCKSNVVWFKLHFDYRPGLLGHRLREKMEVETFQY